MSVTIRDISKATGLSLATISKYLNGGNVLPKNREKIEKAIKELDYEVNEIARWLATNKTKTVGVIVYDIQSLFTGTLVSYIGDALRKAGYGLLICDSANSEEQESNNFRFLIGKKVDGILVIPVNNGKHHIESTRKAEIPVVFMDRPGDESCSCVKIDNALAAHEAVNYLADRGHRRIAVIGSYGEYTGLERCRGFSGAMIERDLAVDKDYLKIVPKASIAAGYESMKQLLSLRERPTAVFMTNYEITLGGVMAVNESDVRCPEDISMFGFDNLILSQIVRPKMTMVVQPMREMAEKSVFLLLEEMKDQPDTEKKIINLPTMIEEGNSIINID